MKIISFYHDVDARQDKKFVKLYDELGKVHSDLPIYMYGLFWMVVEYITKNGLKTEEVPMLARHFKVKKKKLYSLLKDYGLFEIKNGKWTSERIEKNIEKMTRKNQYTEAKAQWHKEQEDIALQIQDKYNSVFGKDVIFSKATMSKIVKINKENALSPDDWELIFKNAFRGWDFPDGKNKKPSLSKILQEWEAFKTDDYNLAPDREIKQDLIEKNEKARKLINGTIAAKFIEFREYNSLPDWQELEAQKIYEKFLSKGEETAMEKTLEYCRGVKNV